MMDGGFDGTYGYVDPLSLPKLNATDLAAGRGAGVFLEHGPAERQFERAAPAFIDDPDATGLFPPQGRFPVVYPPPFVAVFERATVVGYRTVLSDGRVCNDQSLAGAERARQFVHWRSKDPFLNEDTGLAGMPESDRLVLWENDRPRVHLPGTAMLLTSHEPSNYGSWLFRALPKVHALRYCAEPPKVLAYAHNDSTRQSLAACGVPAGRVVAHDVWRIYEVDRLIVPCLRNSHAFLDPETRALYATLRQRFADGTRGRRLYVSRLSHGRTRANGRVMQNEPELVAAVRGIGFDIVEPETLSFVEQVAAFASASLVVGPSGSAMFNAVFCEPGTRLIDIESEPHWLHAHMCLFSSSGLDYGIFVGRVDETDPNPVHRRWSVNIPALLERIAGFADGHGPAGA